MPLQTASVRTLQPVPIPAYQLTAIAQAVIEQIREEFILIPKGKPIPEGQSVECSIENIISHICNHFRITREELFQDRRKYGPDINFAEIRYMISLLCTTQTFPISQNAISAAIGRNHSTVLYGQRKATQLMEPGPGYNARFTHHYRIIEAMVNEAS